VIRNSRWRCDHGWDIDLDDGSTNYDLYNNLMLNKGLKLREGFRRHAWNNLAPFGSLHPHVWYQGSKDQVYANIFANSHATARMSKKYIKKTKVDENLFTTNANAISKAKKLGWDSNSKFGDAQYVDPENGDFRVKEDSPALALGFKNFNMDQFGVKKEALKAIARTPLIPALNEAPLITTKTAAQTSTKTLNWYHAFFKNLSGEEFSAFGVSKEDGGVEVVDIKQKSPLIHMGLKVGDLVQAVDGVKTPDKKTFLKNITGKKTLTLKAIRNQEIIEIHCKFN